ncbi:sigma-54-dependent Fis family transcriptional regulator [uncultured Eubacterium sp.]|uniref:sigma-54-dependent Fis family transcriptional regulator n=1 Tax=uncultured Eubacterium sp. TaxID=165185 RepID=UPI0025E99475|nr:sigma 54-interacting transcriptional regulator [uncultured Eubacterium sp.]
MITYTDEYANTTGNYWQQYIADGTPLPQTLDTLRPEILASWKRSIAYGIDPLVPIHTSLPAEQLQVLLEQNHDLIQTAHAHMAGFFPYIKGTNFAMALANADGYILDLITDDGKIRNQATKTGLRIGCRRSENATGTSGIAMCLAIDEPCEVYGKEHFLECNQEYACCAAPLHDQNGLLIGCLSLIGPCNLTSAHSLGMITAAADGIQKEFSLRIYARQLASANNNLNLMLNSLSNAVLLIDRAGTVIQYNKKALDMFQPGRSLTGLSLYELLGSRKMTDTIIQTTKSIYNQEATITTVSGKSQAILINVSCCDSESQNLILTIDKRQNIYKLVNSISHFSAKYTFDTIIGDSLSMKQVKKLGELAAKNDSNLLILGECGTGKDLLAQAVHNASNRANGPFLPINCAALPKNLIESELFGYEGGAFTGAQKNGAPGKFELAEDGTIFLDEIGDMPLELQTTLLRVLQNKEIIRVGGKKPIPINVRVIAATNSNLEEAVQNKQFRSDLYYRLNVLSITIPPLRYRKEDISPLIDHFTKSHTSGELDLNFFTPEDRQLMLNYNWPGNVRELENMVERVICSSADGTISSSQILKLFLHVDHQISTEPSDYSDPDLINDYYTAPQAVPDSAVAISPFTASSMHKPETSAAPVDATAESTLPLSPAKECAMIIQVLREEHGHIPSVSERLHIPRRTLYRKIKKYNIDLTTFRVW